MKTRELINQLLALNLDAECDIYAEMQGLVLHISRVNVNIDNGHNLITTDEILDMQL